MWQNDNYCESEQRVYRCSLYFSRSFSESFLTVKNKTKEIPWKSGTGSIPGRRTKIQKLPKASHDAL